MWVKSKDSKLGRTNDYSFLSKALSLLFCEAIYPLAAGMPLYFEYFFDYLSTTNIFVQQVARCAWWRMAAPQQRSGLINAASLCLLMLLE
jgi:hypothetical protein